MANTQTVTLDELLKQNVRDLIQSIADDQLFLTIKLPNGEEVVLSPKVPLKPLKVLHGSVPDGWKDAIYNGSR